MSNAKPGDEKCILLACHRFPHPHVLACSMDWKVHQKCTYKDDNWHWSYYTKHILTENEKDNVTTVISKHREKLKWPLESHCKAKEQVYLQLLSNTQDSFGVIWRSIYRYSLLFVLQAYSTDVHGPARPYRPGQSTAGTRARLGQKALSVWQGAAGLLHVSELWSLGFSSQFVAK